MDKETQPEALPNEPIGVASQLNLGNTRDIGSRVSDLLLGGSYIDAEKIAVWNGIPLNLLPKVYAVIAEKELQLNSDMTYGQFADVLAGVREAEVNMTPVKRLVRAFNQVLAHLRSELKLEDSIRELVYRVEIHPQTKQSILRLCSLKEGNSDYHPETDVVFRNPKYVDPYQ